jgi:N-acetylglucosamine-6-phosphate deacetylase
MYITSYEFELLCNGGKEITSEANLATRNNSNTLLSSPLTINKKAERHASNRERLLKAAIYILSKYPDDCRGERKEISPEKWRDALMTHVSEVPPLMITNEEVILRQLRAAVNGKGDS